MSFRFPRTLSGADAFRAVPEDAKRTASQVHQARIQQRRYPGEIPRSVVAVLDFPGSIQTFRNCPEILAKLTHI